MTAIVAPAAGTGSGGDALAQNDPGTSVVGLAPSAIHTLVTMTPGSKLLRGFKVHGTANHTAWVEVDGTPLPGVIAAGSIVKDAYLVLPNPMAYSSAGATVTLRVRNEDSRAGDFEGMLFGV